MRPVMDELEVVEGFTTISSYDDSIRPFLVIMTKHILVKIGNHTLGHNKQKYLITGVLLPNLSINKCVES